MIPTALPEDRSLALIREEAGLAADSLVGRLDDAVAYCPGWTGRDLALHLAGVYRWVSHMVREQLDAPPGKELRAELFTDPDPTDEAGVLQRLRDGADLVTSTLRAAPADARVWTVWPVEQTGRDFWIRRQLHETAVHRVDAQNTGRTETDALSGKELDPVVATDGVDEMMLGFAFRYAKLRLDRPATLAVEATDSGHAWWAQLGPDAPVFGRGTPPTPADTTVRGAAGELLVLLWNRRGPDGLDVTGDHDLLAQWRDKARLNA
jgi:uncharacterized protein (TIGR03083 family)